jgi:L-gulono-1,4-lactone dehydrogenase
MSTWSNWSGLESASPSRIVDPGSTEEIVALVNEAAGSGGTVKPVGAGHSFTGIANPGTGVQLLPGRSGIVAVDRVAMTVTAYAGTRLKTLNAALEQLGLSLHNMGDIAEQSLAGAISTGTHGTGGRVASIAAQVVGLTMVTGTGEVLECTPTRNAEVFDHARLGLGALGILDTVTFAVEPLFALRAVERPMGWDEFVAGFDAMTAEADHLDAYWFPHTDRLLTKANTRRPITDVAPLPRWRTWLDDDFLQNTAFGALTGAANRRPRAIPRLDRFAAGLLSARTYADVAHRVFTTERRVVFREMEYAVPRADGLAVLAECREAIDRSGLEISFPVELRVAPADTVPLSTATRRDVMYLAFHTHRAMDHRAYFAAVEPVLLAADGRPHWGKLHTLSATELASAYPRFGEFVALRDRLDPERVFGNDYLRRVLG